MKMRIWQFPFVNKEIFISEVLGEWLLWVSVLEYNLKYLKCQKHFKLIMIKWTSRHGSGGKLVQFDVWASQHTERKKERARKGA